MEGADVSHLKAIGALNFLDLDDIPVLDEGIPSASSLSQSSTNDRRSRGSNARRQTLFCGGLRAVFRSFAILKK